MAGDECQNASFTMLIQFLGVTFFTKIFPIIRYRWDLDNFPLSACEHYDRACLNPNNSKKGRPTPDNFTVFVHSYVLYKKLASDARSVAQFPGEVPVKTRHFTEMIIFARSPCLKLNYSEHWIPIPVLFSELVQNYAQYKSLVWQSQRVAPFLCEVTLKTRNSTKFTIFHDHMHEMCKGWENLVGWIT